MYQLIRDALRRLVPRERPKLTDAAADETAEEKSMLQVLREEARRRVRQGDPKLDEAAIEISREWTRMRMRQEHPNLDEAAVGEIVENVERVYQLITDICRRRVQEKHPKLDEVDVEVTMMLIAKPPMQMVESALVQRMHLPAEERMQQVAMIMVDKVFSL